MTDAETNLVDAEQFAAQAREFCTFIQRAHTLELRERMRVALQRIVKLIALGEVLPAGHVTDDCPTECDAPLPSHWPGFDEYDLYWVILDPYQEGAPAVGSLSDDVLDIYLDLTRGLVHYEAGNIETALWEWSFHYRAHWGRHATNALSALRAGLA